MFTNFYFCNLQNLIDNAHSTSVRNSGRWNGAFPRTKNDIVYSEYCIAEYCMYICTAYTGITNYVNFLLHFQKKSLQKKALEHLHKVNIFIRSRSYLKVLNKINDISAAFNHSVDLRGQRDTLLFSTLFISFISSYYRSYIQINIDIIQQTYLLFENNKYLLRTRKISYLKSAITSKKPIHFSKNGCVFQNVFLQCSLSYNVNLVHRTLKCILDPLS